MRRVPLASKCGVYLLPPPPEMKQITIEDLQTFEFQSILNEGKLGNILNLPPLPVLRTFIRSCGEEHYPARQLRERICWSNAAGPGRRARQSHCTHRKDCIRPRKCKKALRWSHPAHRSSRSHRHSKIQVTYRLTFCGSIMNSMHGFWDGSQLTGTAMSRST